MFMPGFTTPHAFLDLWTRAAREHLDRLEQLGEQLARAQGQGVERAQQAVDETARLMKESLSYALTLSNDWRKLNLDLARKATEGLRTSA